MKKTTLKTLKLCILFSSLLLSCQKNTVDIDENYLQAKEKVDSMVAVQAKRLVTIGTLPSSNSWTSSPSIPTPSLIKCYYCNSTPSPLGSGYIRFHYQIEVDATTKTYLCSNNTTKRLELRFATYYTDYASTSGWKYYTKAGLSACADWPRCMYIDVPTAGLSMPEIVVAAIVPNNGTSNYQTGNSSVYWGWNGLFSFTTPPTFSISKSFQIDLYPGGPGPSAACPL